jgi:hypothetical protein
MGCNCGKRFSGTPRNVPVNSQSIQVNTGSNTRVITSAPQPNIQYSTPRPTRRAI